VKNSQLLIIIGAEKMPEKEEYSYDELGEHEKTNAVFDIDSMVRAILGLYTGARMVDRR